MNGLLLMLSLNFTDAQAQGRRGVHHDAPIAVAHEATNFESQQLAQLVRQWEDAAFNRSRRGQIFADNALRDWIRNHMAQQRAHVNAARIDVDNITFKLQNARREARFNNHPRSWQRVRRLERRLSFAQNDLNLMENNLQFARQTVQQLRSLQPRFEQGFATRPDYRAKRQLLWQLVDISSQQPATYSTVQPAPNTYGYSGRGWNGQGNWDGRGGNGGRGR